MDSERDGFRTLDGLEAIDPSVIPPKKTLIYPLPAMPNDVVTPPAIDGDGYVYLCLGDHVLVLDPSGALTFTIDLSVDGGEGVEFSSLAIGNGVLYATAVGDLHVLTGFVCNASEDLGVEGVHP